MTYFGKRRDRMNVQNNVLPEARLIFEIQCPSLEECWVDGYETAMANGLEDCNPYAKASSEYQHWNDGWWSGFYGESPINTYQDHQEISQDCPANMSQMESAEACNESIWTNPRFRLWAGRLVKVAGIVAVTAAAMQLANLAA
jgi:hypothetical protein